VNSESFIPVKSLNPQSNADWVIKVRVIKRYEKRTWSNDKGQGLLMNVDLMDAQGTLIQGTLFKDAVERFE
jgi:replication factor A1